MKITLIPILKDNYAYHLQSDDNRHAVIDPGDTQPIIDYFENIDIVPDYILNTHHHWDHTDGNLALKAAYDLKIVGPEYEASRIPGIDVTVSEDAPFMLGNEELHILHTPGHTAGHISFYAPQSKAVFTGDALFSMGCGRLFEGDANDLWSGFEKLRALPGDTQIYCGHEYTIANAKFCLKHDPDNEALQKRYAEVKELRRKKNPTIPTAIGLEKETNLFLMAKSVQDLAGIRALKDKA